METIDILEALRIGGNEKGAAVRTLDTRSGPYSDIELEAIQSACNGAYAEGKIELADYVLIWLLMLLGSRPAQLALLKISDFNHLKSKDGTSVYMLRVPRTKQRGSSVRSHFSERSIAPQIGRAIADYIACLRLAYIGIVDDVDQLPLFSTDGSRVAPPKGFDRHMTAGQIGSWVSDLVATFLVVSERTGQLIDVSATRFRRTLGSRAASEGHGELVIAELLDHTDTQNVGAYVESRPEIVDRIDRAIALKMAPMAQAFAGMIVIDESDAERGDDPTSRIVHPGLSPSLQPMGTCGKHGFCGLAAPIACYTCRNFQPWVDGPHEAVLDHLLEERQRLAIAGDLRIASINDRTILAVAEVVRQCDAMLSQPGDQTDG